MRRRVLVVSGLAGMILGAAVAYIGAARIFTCVEPTYEAVCAGGFPMPAVAWGVTIGLAVGLLVGLVISRRLVPN